MNIEDTRGSVKLQLSVNYYLLNLKVDEKTSKAFNNFSVKNEFGNIKNEKNIKTEGKKEYMNQGMSN